MGLETTDSASSAISGYMIGAYLVFAAFHGVRDRRNRRTPVGCAYTNARPLGKFRKRIRQTTEQILAPAPGETESNISGVLFGKR